MSNRSFISRLFKKASLLGSGQPKRRYSRYLPAVERFESRLVLAAINEFPLPDKLTSPRGITTGPDGNLWFTVPLAPTSNGNYVGRLAPNGSLTQFRLPTDADSLEGIVTGPDGNLWFNGGEPPGAYDPLIGRITPDGGTTLF